MRDVYTDALNAPAGSLAQILLKKLPASGAVGEIPDDMRRRLDRLAAAPGNPGKLARVRLAAEVSYLFERAPEWTKMRIIPLFEWSSPDASDAWEARKYSRFIGSPELFALTKQPFLEMFGRSGIASDSVRKFGEWLPVILIANKHRKEGDLYPLTATEARAALRRAGVEALSSVGHRLATEMELAKPEERAERWRTIVGPVFKAIWPLDVELHDHMSTFKLVQILKATGEAFPEAADIILPFIQPDDSRSHSAIFSIAGAPEALYVNAPAKMLDLIAAVVGEASPGSVFSLGEALSRVRESDPSLANTRKFQKLLGYAMAT